MSKLRLVLLSIMMMFIASGANAGFLKLSYPSASTHAFENYVVGIDHYKIPSSVAFICKDYLGRNFFPYCYAGHEGVDFILKDGFEAMDRGVDVRASAPGVVVEVISDKFDRCSATYFPRWKVTCENDREVDEDEPANYVMVRQDDGLFAIYYHMKKFSARVHEGERVTCGTVLGEVGSSGYSSGPHIHLELRQLNTGFNVSHPTYDNIYKISHVIDPFEQGLWRDLNKETILPFYTCGM